MDFVNLTPHAINVVGGPTFPPSGAVARCSVVTLAEGAIGGIPVMAQQMGPVEGLPDPQEGTFFIVSAMVRDAAERMGRTDCLSPGGLVRNDAGAVVGCQGLLTGIAAVVQ